LYNFTPSEEADEMPFMGVGADALPTSIVSGLRSMFDHGKRPPAPTSLRMKLWRVERLRRAKERLPYNGKTGAQLRGYQSFGQELADRS
jgi:hypothetical protein